MTESLVARIIEFVSADEKIRFAYLFGSVARGDAGPLSDIDVAVFLDDAVDRFAYRLKLMESLARTIGTERFDLVVLNDLPVTVCHPIIKEGIVLKEDRSRRVEFETRVMREYLDTAYFREVRYQYLKRKAQEEGFLGK